MDIAVSFNRVGNAPRDVIAATNLGPMGSRLNEEWLIMDIAVSFNRVGNAPRDVIGATNLGPLGSRLNEE